MRKGKSLASRGVARRNAPAVCVQPLLVRRAREGEDFTRSRSDFGHAAIIARLTAELRCYLPSAGGVMGAAASPGRAAELVVRAVAAREHYGTC